MGVHRLSSYDKVEEDRVPQGMRFFRFYTKCWGLVDIRIHKTPYFI